MSIKEKFEFETAEDVTNNELSSFLNELSFLHLSEEFLKLQNQNASKSSSLNGRDLIKLLICRIIKRVMK